MDWHWLLALIPLGFLAILFMGLAGASSQYEPMSPDEEEKWLREKMGLSDEEITEIMTWRAPSKNEQSKSIDIGYN
jgi:hypothetical protein